MVPQIFKLLQLRHVYFILFTVNIIAITIFLIIIWELQSNYLFVSWNSSIDFNKIHNQFLFFPNSKCKQYCWKNNSNSQIEENYFSVSY